ncbi:LLM class flavin-dependent oxidoreductase [Ktedonosporobacter rubrisoli]|uniref:LLM class flavin-dependent oxidoreductase n=1 Tax=Ktedonosporobacter rubrisoli TaxID=2509675 RepID=A0A4V0YZV6_KTERU|nr:LLM class flavin-dependent oxidoreductase [Ktedonosporobacter rubrisoli]QBD81051.1 LLM class flavin-dependent oxidoreductase [Ktedonosporobacter rubrisoli]
MKIGIELPTTIPNVTAQLIRAWARQADAGPFSSLGIVDRLAYNTFDPLVSLAAVATETQRIRLMTGVLLAPMYNAGRLAKQAASLDVLSNGRLSLGLAIGGNEEDFRASPASFSGRGKRFEQQLELMTRVWAGQPVDDKTGPIGPTPLQPGGPEILLGGQTPAAIGRLKRWGNGYIAAGLGSPAQVGTFFRQAEEAWQSAGRPGKPRLVVATYFALGPGAAEQAEAYLLEFYGIYGPLAQEIAKSVSTTPEAVQARIQEFADVGADELLFAPCIPELDQVQRLADVANQWMREAQN